MVVGRRGHHRSSRVLVALCLVVVASLVPQVAFATITPVPVKNDPNIDEFDPTTNTVFYQQVSQSHSDIYSFDLDTKTRTKVPGASSKTVWESDPRVSTSSLLFVSYRYRNGAWYRTLVLQNRGTLHTTALGTWKETAYNALIPGSVGVSYATYTICQRFSCRAFVYAIVGGTRQKIPVPTGKSPYSPVVDEVGGTLYFMRSGRGCGLGVGLWSLPVTDLSASPTKLGSLPAGVDTNLWQSLGPDPTTLGGLDILFSYLVCKANSWDAYRFPDVNG